MKIRLLCAAVLLAGGCVSVEVMAPSATTVELSFDAGPDESPGALSRGWLLWKFQDPTCRSKEKLVRVARQTPRKPMESVHLPVGAPVTLALAYVEGRMGVAHRCSYTWTLTPEAGERYLGTFDVDALGNCSVRITGSSGTPVNVTTPTNTCVYDESGAKAPNGRATITRLDVQFTTQPAR